MEIQIQKGTFQYIRRQKKRKTVLIFVIFIMALLIFLAGLFLNQMSNANIFTVIAVLCVLPWAKQVVALVVFFPFRSVSETRFQKMQSLADTRPDVRFYADLVITSPEHIMNLDFLVIGSGWVICRMGKAGQDVKEIKKYLTDGVHARADFTVKMTESDEDFIKALQTMDDREEITDDEINAVDEYVCSLMV